MTFRSATVTGAMFLAILSVPLMQTNSLAAEHTVRVDALTNSEEHVGDKTYQVSKLVINASPEKVQSVLDDYDNAPKLFVNVKKCKVVKEGESVRDVAFTVTSMNNLLTLDYVLELDEQPGLIQWHRLKGAFKSNDGYWKMESINDGKATLVTYAKHVEGGPFMPQVFVTREVRACMPQVMENLKAAAEAHAKVALK